VLQRSCRPVRTVATATYPIPTRIVKLEFPRGQFAQLAHVTQSASDEEMTSHFLLYLLTPAVPWLPEPMAPSHDPSPSPSPSAFRAFLSSSCNSILTPQVYSSALLPSPPTLVTQTSTVSTQSFSNPPLPRVEYLEPFWHSRYQ
jgi:hypothetical protein